MAVGYTDGTMTGRFDGPAFPQNSDSLNGYALLVVDDTSQRVQGVLIYESTLPRNHPRLGLVASGDRSLPLYGVRVDWLSMTNPKCPLLGDTATTR